MVHAYPNLLPRRLFPRNCLRVLVVLTLLLLSAPVTTGARADVAGLKVAEDSYTSQNNPGATHGPSTYLGTNASVSSERRAYLKFAVANIPVGATNVTAKLSVYAQSSSSGTFTVYNIPSTWTESSLTWSNQPILGSIVTQKGGVTTGYNDLDVSSAVAANGTYSFVIRSSATSQTNFTAKEAASNQPAQLLVNWSPPTSGDPVLGAAGDIACAPGGAVTATACQQAATAALLAGNDVTVVQTLGDEQYESGASAEFTGGYDRSWGQLKYKTDPTPGNHEYLTPGATGYFGYHLAAAGDPAKGYYSYSLGAWHIVVLNGEIANRAGSTQELWFRNDLATHPSACTLAVWHEPYFSSTAGTVGRQALFQDAYNGGVDVVLNGHQHNYERFAPQNPSGVADPAHGVRQFVIGTGGKSLWGFNTVLPTSEVRNGTTFGVLKVTLHAGSYDWRFVPIAGSTFTDSGTGTCH
jgi:hypothetical protein